MVTKNLEDQLKLDLVRSVLGYEAEVTKSAVEKALRAGMTPEDP